MEKVKSEWIFHCERIDGFPGVSGRNEGVAKVLKGRYSTIGVYLDSSSSFLIEMLNIECIQIPDRIYFAGGDPSNSRTFK